MKISSSIRELYNNQLEKYQLLAKKVDNVIVNLKKTKWHYESRLKEIESFALKLETGRCQDPSKIDDFFACTLVVENLSSIHAAEELVLQKFTYVERRPNTDNFTSKRPDSFPFDDLRLYVTWKDEPGTKPSGLDGLLFEVQIKTFLQHAWSIATHDLIYKSNEKDWSKERIAFQIKAMLEHAEISICEANSLARSSSLNKENKETQKITKIINMINSIWEPKLLPFDVKRLAENIHNLLINIDLKVDDMNRLIDNETHLGRGTKTLNLSPYGIIVQTLFDQAHEKMERFLFSEDKKFKILIHKDIEIPEGINIKESKNVIIVQ